MAYIGKSPTGTGVRSRFYYTQTSGGGTSISGTDDNSKTLTFTDGEYIDVFLNGVLLVAGTDYNTNTANTISGLAALANGDVVEVVVYDIFTVADTVSASQGGTFNAGITMSDGLTVDDDGAAPLTVDRASSDGDAIIIQKDGSTVGSIGNSGTNFFIGGAADSAKAGVLFSASKFTPIKNLAEIDNAVDIGSSSNRFKNLYLSGGAYIGGTGAANHLDDVEEGTFTATLNGSGGHPATRLTTTGYYQKVNNMVYINLNFNSVTTTSYSGQISVFGLPFTCGNGAGRQALTVGSYAMASFSSSTGSIFGHLSDGNTEIYILGIRSASSWEDVVHSAGSSRFLQITGTYTAA